MRIAHKPKKEPQIKSKSCNIERESKSSNRKTKTTWQQTSLTIPNCNPQISNNQTKREPLFLTHHPLNFPQQHYAYMGVDMPKPVSKLF